MRDFHGTATQVTAATPEECFALLAAVDRYPSWCPDAVRDVEVLDRDADGRPSRARMHMHVTLAGFDREFDLFLAIGLAPLTTVRLTRVTDHPTNQEFTATWRLHEAGGTSITLDLDARLRVPAYVPAAGVGDAIAQAFVAAACRALAAPSSREDDRRVQRSGVRGTAS